MTASLDRRPAPPEDDHSQMYLRFLQQAAEINCIQATDVGQLTFLSRVTVQANLPLRDPKKETFERKNGRYTLTLQAPPSIGLPFGRYPRLLLAFLGREAVKTRSREIRLGESLSGFMREVGVTPSGGPKGPMRRFRDQARRLLATTISCSWTASDEAGNEAAADIGQRLASRSFIWWAQPGASRPPGELDGGWLVLTEEFYEELLAHPVPVDARALRALTAPLALDIYAWLTWRMSHLPKAIEFSWPALATQFGTQTRRLRNFRQEFNKQLERVLQVYPSARVESSPRALVLRPSRTHIRSLPRTETAE